MSNEATPAPVPPPAVPAAPQTPKEIRIVSHSSLYYWWPVWLFGFIFSLWTLADNERMAIVPSTAIINKVGNDYVINAGPEEKNFRLLHDAIEFGEGGAKRPTPRVTSNSSIGPLFFVIVILVIIITNVPLRGLWSLIIIFTVIVFSLILTIMGTWDWLLDKFGHLHIYMNLAGYLFFSVVLFLAWVFAVLIFDRRTYMVFTPGQVKVCEEIGGREKVYDTTGMSIEKHRDDWFRHIILGMGTGDLTVRTAGADRHEIIMPNVILIGYKIAQIEMLIRERQTKAG